MSEIADSRQATGEKDLLRNQSEDQCPTFSKESSDEIRFVGDEDLPRCESVDEIRIQVQESVPSMVVQVGKELVLDAYNLFDEMPMGDNSEKLQENCNLDLNKEFASLNIPLRRFDSDMQEIQSNNSTEVFDDLKMDGDSSKVISDHVEAIAYDVSYEEKDVIAGELSDSSKIRLCDFKGKIFEFGAISTAHHVFVEMPNRGFNGIDYSTQLSNAHLLMGNWNLDPGDFIDLRLAKKASLEFQGILLREVAVAKGNKTCVFFYPGILKRGDCDMVLRGDKLREYSLVLFNPRLLQISFLKEGKQIKIKGVKEKASLGRMSSFKQKGSCTRIFVFDPGIVNKEDGKAARIGIEYIIQQCKLHPQEEISRRDFLQLFVQISDVFAGFLEDESRVFVYSITGIGSLNSIKITGLVFYPGGDGACIEMVAELGISACLILHKLRVFVVELKLQSRIDALFKFSLLLSGDS